jgi:hypothetical protein
LCARDIHSDTAKTWQQHYGKHRPIDKTQR